MTSKQSSVRLADTADLLGQIEELESALRFYAEWRNYRWAVPDGRNQEHSESNCAVIQRDSWLGGQPGSRARAALARVASNQDSRPS